MVENFQKGLADRRRAAQVRIIRKDGSTIEIPVGMKSRQRTERPVVRPKTYLNEP